MFKNNSLLSHFRDAKVLITGDTGFKGSWLSFALANAGAKIWGYSLPSDVNSHYRYLELETLINHIDGDIRDFIKLSKLIADIKPEFIFHLAAQALVGQSYKNPLETYSTNIMGSANLLEAIRSCDSVRSVIYVTSDKCYQNNEWVWGYRESDILGGDDPYSSSKACAELIFSSFSKSYFDYNKSIGLASVRAGNVIGGGDWSMGRIVPDCIGAIHGDTPIKLRSPKATRPWQHVLEPLSGYMLLAKKINESGKLFSGSWNFGPNKSENRNVLDVAKEIVKVMGSGSIEILGDQSMQIHEANLLQLNCDKANTLIGWNSKWSFEETIKITAGWYKAFYKGRPPREITKNNLEKYFCV